MVYRPSMPSKTMIKISLYHLLLQETMRLVSMVVECSVELYTHSVDITMNIFRNFNSTKYILFRKDFPQVKFCKIHFFSKFRIPQSTLFF